MARVRVKRSLSVCEGCRHLRMETAVLNDTKWLYSCWKSKLHRRMRLHSWATGFERYSIPKGCERWREHATMRALRGL